MKPVTGPSQLSVVNNQYSPNPFDVVATVFNSGTATATGVVVTISLPVGLSLTTANPFISVGDLTPGQERQVSWRVIAAPQSTDTTLTYAIAASASNAQPKTVRRQVFLPALSLSHCDSPSSIFANNVQASGLVEEAVSNFRTENGQLVADVTVDNFLRGVWLEVTRISLSSAANELTPNNGAGTAGVFAQAGLVPPCETGLNGLLKCKDPGRSAWTAKFCSKGTITIEMQQGPRAASLTLIDAIIGVEQIGNLNTALSLVRELEQEVPLFAQAKQCLSTSSKSSFSCASKALFKLATNRTQLEKSTEILTRFSVFLSVEELIKKITGAAVHLLQTAADGIVFVIQTTKAGTYPLVRVTLDGDSFAIAKSGEHRRTSRHRYRANHRTD